MTNIQTPGLYMGLVFLLAVIMVLTWRLHATFHEMDDLLEELDGHRPPSPWASQLLLMVKSSQVVPDHPVMTPTVILYGALILEEAAETLAALSTAIRVAYPGDAGACAIAKDYFYVSRFMAMESVHIRNQLLTCENLPAEAPLSRGTAAEILDGCTDLHVVTAGLSIACGLPGEEAHEEVTRSNLSKANPVTGMIDKDGSGKWIKGEKYQAPNLKTLLDPYYDYRSQG
jgi:hypothetical protein